MPQGQPMGMARGGLALAAQHLQDRGRGGDTILAHINPREAEMLRRMGGSGTVNPNTGLREYKGFFDIVGSILPIAAAFIPGLGPILSPIVGAVVGGASSALKGGDVLQGALTGGIGGGLGAVVGGGLNSVLGTEMSAATQNLVGSGLVGGLAGVVSGKGALQGATQGVIGGVIGNMANPNATGMLDKSLSAAATRGGNAITAGASSQDALTQAAMAGLGSAAMTGLSAKPSDAVVNNVAESQVYDPNTGSYKTVTPTPAVVNNVAESQVFNPATGKYDTVTPTPAVVNNVAGSQVFNPTTGKYDTVPAVAPAVAAAAATPSKGLLGGIGQYALPALLAYSALGSALGSAPKPVQDAMPTLSASQQEYFNRPSITWDWNKLQQDASASGQNLGSYIAQNWNRVSGGTYNNPMPIKAARGGALTEIANYARGSGSGRDDTINAKLSDGEYVMDAETVALLGDGSSEEGAKRLDAMRNNIRAHKGRALAKGKISPNAKSPLSYLKGVR